MADRTTGVKNLLKAIAEDNQPEFSRLVGEVELNLPDYPTQRTPIFSAAFKGSTYFTNSLINKGALVNVRDFEGKSPLMEAARCGHDAVVRLMLDKGAEIDAKDDCGRTALFYAVEWKRDTVVRTLMQAGCQLGCITTGRALKNNPDAMKGLTVSHIAAFIGMPQQSLHLFYAGALKNRFNLGEADEAEMIRQKDFDYRQAWLAAHNCEDPIITYERKQQLEARRLEMMKTANYINNRLYEDNQASEINQDYFNPDLSNSAANYKEDKAEDSGKRPISPTGSIETNVPKTSVGDEMSPVRSP